MYLLCISNSLRKKSSHAIRMYSLHRALKSHEILLSVFLQRDANNGVMPQRGCAYCAGGRATPRVQ